jgi:hypothetical protein
MNNELYLIKMISSLTIPIVDNTVNECLIICFMLVLILFFILYKGKDK